MGGQVEKSFEEYAKEGEQIPEIEILRKGEPKDKVPVSAIIGALIAIAGPDVIDQALPPVDEKEEV